MSQTTPRSQTSDTTRKYIVPSPAKTATPKSTKKTKPALTQQNGSYRVTLYCGKGKSGYKDGAFADAQFNGLHSLLALPNGYVINKISPMLQQNFGIRNW